LAELVDVPGAQTLGSGEGLLRSLGRIMNQVIGTERWPHVLERSGDDVCVAMHELITQMEA